MKNKKKYIDWLTEGKGKPYRIGPSNIHGNGVHAKKWLDPEVNVGKATDPYPAITPMGRMINHSRKPNCILKRTQNGGHDLVTKQGIDKDEELTLDYGEYDEFIGPNDDWK